jgi:hypothetical protein
MTQPSLHFDGETYDPPKDHARLSKQLDRVFALMRDGRYRTLAELSACVGAPEGSVSARLRDLRKQKFGGWVVDRKRIGNLHHYAITGKQTPQGELLGRRSDTSTHVSLVGSA